MQCQCYARNTSYIYAHTFNVGDTKARTCTRARDRMQGLQSYPCLALRSKDTIDTLDRQQKTYNRQSYAHLHKKMHNNTIHPCVNLQKKSTGLSGFMVEVCGDIHIDIYRYI